ncbi:MAG: hypothetical protein AUI12_16610 [Acidobacteria bacterium 13_2_20CM_2_57_6]|jgi:hypothetical protein|nr:MAG: hypothetical protein AUI12_16610 [Acidobacteria bacterium 13_2_20CM_2_57_6]PYT57825.1 MAG: hypothetical protein DMG46_12790 [Acidobacteriota bacterium]
MTDKWGRRLFKAGTVALLILGLVHSLSLIRDLVPANETERQLIGLMSSYKFNLMGSMRSMADMLRGFSVSFMLGALGFALFDLLLFRERAGLLKRAALANIVWLAAMTAVSLRYFFIIPVSFLAVTLLIFVLAWVKLPAEAST